MHRPVIDEQLPKMRRAFAALEPSNALGARLRASIAGRGRPQPVWSSGPVWVALAMVVFALGTAMGWWLHPSAAGKQPSAHAQPAAIEIMSPQCDVHPAGDGTIQVPAGCRVSLPRGVHVTAWTRTSVRPTPQGLLMRRGVAAFSVETVARGEAAVEIDVGAGLVRVLGTQFVLSNNAEGGHVDLVEGRVEFLRGSEVTSVHPGRRFSWVHDGAPDPSPDPAPRVEPIEPAPSAGLGVRPGPPPGRASKHSPRPKLKHGGPANTQAPLDASVLAATLQTVARLRRQRAFEEALAQLKAFDGRGWDRATRAVLSYERGTLLEAADQITQACAHWSAHVLQYPGVGPTDVVSRRARLQCEE